MFDQNKVNTGIVILAAGESSRLGSPKQLLRFDDEYLLQKVLDIAAASVANNVVVVLGAFSTDIVALLDVGRATVVDNKNWKTGMSSSIICGLEQMLRINRDVDSVLFILCDQPHVNTALINEVFARHFETGSEIVVCNYGHAFGPPVLFHRSLFPQLKLLKGNEGAKNLITLHPEKVSEVFFREGNIDIDTIADYQKLRDNPPKIGR